LTNKINESIDNEDYEIFLVKIYGPETYYFIYHYDYLFSKLIKHNVVNVFKCAIKANPLGVEDGPLMIDGKYLFHFQNIDLHPFIFGNDDQPSDLVSVWNTDRIKLYLN